MKFSSRSRVLDVRDGQEFVFSWTVSIHSQDAPVEGVCEERDVQCLFKYI